MGKPKRKLLYVKWIDAAYPVNDAWRSKEELDDFIDDDFFIVDVGFFLKETKHYIVLDGGHFEDDTDDVDSCFHRILKIPKRNIIKKIDLTRHIR